MAHWNGELLPELVLVCEHEDDRDPIASEVEEIFEGLRAGDSFDGCTVRLAEDWEEPYD